MSKETSTWLNTNVLIGFTDKRGHAWHYRAEDQTPEPNHYPGPIPSATSNGACSAGPPSRPGSSSKAASGSGSPSTTWGSPPPITATSSPTTPTDTESTQYGSGCWTTSPPSSTTASPSDPPACCLKTRYKRVVTNVFCDNTMAAGLREDGQEVAIVHKRNSALQLLRP